MNRMERRRARRQEAVELIGFMVTIVVIMLVLAAGYNGVVPAYQ